jgi:hypothetical protein
MRTTRRCDPDRLGSRSCLPHSHDPARPQQRARRDRPGPSATPPHDAKRSVPPLPPPPSQVTRAALPLAAPHHPTRRASRSVVEPARSRRAPSSERGAEPARRQYSAPHHTTVKRESPGREGGACSPRANPTPPRIRRRSQDDARLARAEPLEAPPPHHPHWARLALTSAPDTRRPKTQALDVLRRVV